MGLRLLFIFSLSVNLFAANNGKIIKLIGSVSALKPGSLKAVNVKIGDVLPEDTSILTQKRSLVRVKFNNGSSVTIGPKSKMVLTVVQDKGSVISLLKGKLRSQVTKKKEKHMYIKTRTAAMGVRGTKFLVNFVPESKRTSLLTFEGQVDISKDVSKIKRIKSKKEAIEHIKKIEEVLKKTAIKTTTADFTNIGVVEDKPISPVKINPAQYALIKKDEGLGVVKKKVSKAELKKEVEFAKKAIKKAKKAGTLKHGGFISQKTGLYIPPSESGSVKGRGKLNTRGEYVPPKNVKLDPHKGFVPADEKNVEAVAKANELNNSLGEQFVGDPDDPMYQRYFIGD